MSVREEVIHLVDDLPEADLATVKRLLEGLILTGKGQPDPLRAFLETCPEDDEPTTEEDLAALVRGRQAINGGELIAHDEVLRRAVRPGA